MTCVQEADPVGPRLESMESASFVSYTTCFAMYAG